MKKKHARHTAAAARPADSDDFSTLSASTPQESIDQVNAPTAARANQLAGAPIAPEGEDLAAPRNADPSRTAPIAAALSTSSPAQASPASGKDPDIHDSRPAQAEAPPEATQDTPAADTVQEDPHCWHCGGTGFDTGFTLEEADNPVPCIFCGGTGRSDGAGTPAEILGDSTSLPAAHSCTSSPEAPIITREVEHREEPGCEDPGYDRFDFVTYRAVAAGARLAVGFLIPSIGMVETVGQFTGKDYSDVKAEDLKPEQAFALGQLLIAAGAEAMAVNARRSSAPDPAAASIMRDGGVVAETAIQEHRPGTVRFCKADRPCQVYISTFGPSRVQVERYNDDAGSVRIGLAGTLAPARLASNYAEFSPEQALQAAQVLTQAALEALAARLDAARAPIFRDPSPVHIDNLIHPLVREAMAFEVERNHGNEVLWIGRCDERGTVIDAEPVAWGNRTSAPALLSRVRAGEVLIHNHPSGNLAPSDEDINASSQVGNRGAGSYIVNNDVDQVRVIVRPALGGAVQGGAGELADAVACYLDSGKNQANGRKASTSTKQPKAARSARVEGDGAAVTADDGEDLAGVPSDDQVGAGELAPGGITISPEEYGMLMKGRRDQAILQEMITIQRACKAIDVVTLDVWNQAEALRLIIDDGSGLPEGLYDALSGIISSLKGIVEKYEVCDSMHLLFPEVRKRVPWPDAGGRP